MKTQKQKKNCYAIYYIDTGDTYIANTWAECQKKTKGRANQFKGFSSEADARKWLSVTVKDSNSTKRTQHSIGNEPQRYHSRKISFQIRLERKDANALREKAEYMKMPIEVLVENLILEYLYDE